MQASLTENNVTARPAVHSLGDAFGHFARAVNVFVSSPSATFAAFAVVVAWALSGPYFRYSDGWQLVINTGTTIVTFLMVFVLNNAQSRDTAAMNAKLDAIILAIEMADNRLVGIEMKSDDDADQIRADMREAATAIDAACGPKRFRDGASPTVDADQQFGDERNGEPRRYH